MWQFGALQERPTQPLHIAAVDVVEVLPCLSRNSRINIGGRSDCNCGLFRPAHRPGGVDFVYEVDHLGGENREVGRGHRESQERTEEGQRTHPAGQLRLSHNTLAERYNSKEQN